jgi:hypothetical protein
MRKAGQPGIREKESMSNGGSGADAAAARARPIDKPQSGFRGEIFRVHLQRTAPKCPDFHQASPQYSENPVRVLEFPMPVLLQK